LNTPPAIAKECILQVLIVKGHANVGNNHFSIWRELLTFQGLGHFFDQQGLWWGQPLFSGREYAPPFLHRAQQLHRRMIYFEA